MLCAAYLVVNKTITPAKVNECSTLTDYFEVRAACDKNLAHTPFLFNVQRGIIAAYEAVNGFFGIYNAVKAAIKS